MVVLMIVLALTLGSQRAGAQDCGYLVVLCASLEQRAQVCALLGDLASSGVDIVTIGQYLRPSGDQLPVARFWKPEEFEALKREGERRGIRHVQSGPLVRSSYHAHEQSASII